MIDKAQHERRVGFFISSMEDVRMQEKIDLLTVEQVAAKLRVHTSWVYRAVKCHGPDAIPRIKVGKNLRFNEVAVMTWLMGNQADDGRKGGKIGKG